MSNRTRVPFPRFGAELRRLKLGLFGLLVALGIGFVGYQLVEGASPFDALYLTMITVSTVGFGEVFELGTGGRMITMAVIVTGVASLSLAAVSAAEFVVEGHLQRAIQGRRMQRAIEHLDNHVIICGYGRVGVHVADELLKSGTAFVVVDDDAEKLSDLDESGRLFVSGDATEEHVLEEAGLARARAVVAAVNSDADNVLITLTAKGLFPDVEIIARAKVDENEGKLRRAGADRVIAPTTIGGRRIAQILTRPTVSDFLDQMQAGSVDILLDEVRVRKGSDLDGITLRDAAIRQRYSCTVLAVRHNDRLDTHPSPDDPLHVGDVVVVMGAEEDVQRLRETYT